MIWLIKTGKIFLAAAYALIKCLPARNKVVMISRQSNQPGVDFTLLGEELKRRSNVKVVYLCKTLEGKENAKIFTAIGYGFHMFRQMFHLATSKVCVLNSYSIAVSLLHHKKSLTVIQMWHSNGTMKKFGYSALGTSEGSSPVIAKLLNMHRNYDVVLCSGAAYADHLCAGFDVKPNCIKIYTLPRFDLLCDNQYEKETREKIYEKYPSLKGKKVVLYAPTFRGKEQLQNFFEHLKTLIDSFDYNYAQLVIKLHPLTGDFVSDGKAIVDNAFTTFDMLFVADGVISDYSCMIYEAGTRDIPLYFYAYDLDLYRHARGLALDYSTLPGYTESDAKALVSDLKKPYDMEELKRFIGLYVENKSGCTERLVDLIESYL
ncbi:MAG: CDP-glycerol glycerophosphotransferase family protein [Clostridia bacterium]|nr:CDP-glycerol glycerophosphotransferase family protein [Clostridia bacterium]